MGKTTVLNLFEKLGAYTFNIDEFVHDILGKESTIRKISSLLGDEVLTKSSSGISLNKKKLAGIIFSDPEKRKAIEEIIHPGVLKEIKAVKLNLTRINPDAFIIFEVPLLFEAHYEKHFDKTIVVHADRQTAIKRLQRKGFTRDEISHRFRSQMPMYKKKKLADYLIENNGDIKKTSERVKKLYHILRNDDQQG
ncbi:MAG: dephospho-CoA kinase [Nitrospiraceae bacterium]|nr:MAG: dephospho-CoA kinase [Nitrospiraceae bacterium]